jgi:hypothetical protein
MMRQVVVVPRVFLHFPCCTSMKARSLPSSAIDLCSVFFKDQFSFYLMWLGLEWPRPHWCTIQKNPVLGFHGWDETVWCSVSLIFFPRPFFLPRPFLPFQSKCLSLLFFFVASHHFFSPTTDPSNFIFWTSYLSTPPIYLPPFLLSTSSILPPLLHYEKTMSVTNCSI